MHGTSKGAQGKHRNSLKPQLQHFGYILCITCMTWGTIAENVFLKLEARAMQDHFESNIGYLRVLPV